jgi:tetratricopeptide (TPR) repeat protein
MTRARSILLLIASVSLCTQALAQAGADEEALIHHGVELRKQGREEEALAEFRRAHDLKPSPRSRAQIAFAEQALGQWVKAETDLLQALAQSDDAWIARNQETLLLALETIREHLGTLEIESNVAGASISVNGSEVGRSPLPAPLRVAAGITSIEVHAAGYGTVERTIDVPARGEVKAAIVIVPLTAPLPVTDAPASHPQAAPASTRTGGGVAPAPAAVAEAAGSPHSAASEASLARDAGGRRSHTLGWVALAASSLLLGTGVVAHVVRENNAAVYNDDSRCFYGKLTRDERCGDRRSATDTASVIAVSGYAAGGVALVVGLTLLLARHDDPPAESATRVAAVLAPGSGHVSLVSSF